MELGGDELPASLRERYEVREILGRGSMGVVYGGVDRSSGQAVAIKVLPPQKSADEEAKKRLEREASSARALNHSAIVQVLDADPEDGWMAMEHVQGESLRARLERVGRLSGPETVLLGGALLSGLEAAHRAGIIHRDVKPANIMLTEPGPGVVVPCKLADFGIATMRDARLTETGKFLGTPAYMAPEQLRARTVDARVDIYAAGATLFETCTGLRLHTESASVLDPEAEVLAATADPRLAAAIARAVDDRPEARFASAAEFAVALTGQGSLSEAIAPAPAPAETTQTVLNSKRRPSRRLLRSIAIGAAFLGLIAAAYLSLGPRTPLATKSTPRIALFPCENHSSDTNLSYATAGVPYLLGLGLSDLPDVEVLGYYQLAARASNAAELFEVAKTLGATHVVRGEIRKASSEADLDAPGGPLSLELEITLLDGTSILRLSRRTTATDLTRVALESREPILRAILGSLPESLPTAAPPPLDELFLLGVEAIEQHRVAEAVTKLSRARTLSGPTGELEYYLALSTWWNGAPIAEVLGHADAGLSLGVSSPKRRFLESLKLMLGNRYAESIAAFQLAHARWPEDRDILYGLFEAQYHGGQPREAIATYRALLQRSPRFRLGLIHVITWAVTQYDAPTIAWANAIIEPLGYEWAYWRARILLAHRDYEGARKVLGELTDAKRAADRSTGFAYAQNALVEANLGSGATELAEAIVGVSVEAGTAAAYRYAIAVARGSEAVAERREALAVIAALSSEHIKIDRYSEVAMVELSLATPERLREIDQKLTELSPAEGPSGPVIGGANPPAGAIASLNAPLELRTSVLRAIVRGLLHDEDGLRSLDPYPETLAIVRAFRAEWAGDARAAAQAWADSAAAGADGRFIPFERYREAEQRALLGDRSGVVERCGEAIEPRLFAQGWAAVVGPCLLLTAEAEQALGHPALAQAAVDRLLALRTKAGGSDPFAERLAKLRSRLP